MRKNINTLLQDAYDVCEDLGIEVGHIISINWNSRLKKTWGLCTETKYGYKIELNPILGDECCSWEDAMDTVIHEVLHAHPDRMCHTGEWKRCAELVNNSEYGDLYHISRCASAYEKGLATAVKAKYRVTCVNCGRITNYMREGKAIKSIMRGERRYICPVCKSYDLRVEVLR